MSLGPTFFVFLIGLLLLLSTWLLACVYLVHVVSMSSILVIPSEPKTYLFVCFFSKPWFFSKISKKPWVSCQNFDFSKNVFENPSLTCTKPVIKPYKTRIFYKSLEGSNNAGLHQKTSFFWQTLGLLVLLLLLLLELL